SEAGELRCSRMDYRNAMALFSSTPTWAAWLFPAALLACLLWILALLRRAREQTFLMQAQLEHEALLRARYFALVESNPLAIVSHDREGRVLLCNPAFERMFGYRRGGGIGGKMEELIAAGALFAEGTQFTRDAISGITCHRTTRRARQDGSLVDVELHGVPFEINGESIGAYGLYQDITARKQVEKLAAETQDQLRKAKIDA